MLWVYIHFNLSSVRFGKKRNSPLCSHVVWLPLASQVTASVSGSHFQFRSDACWLLGLFLFIRFGTLPTFYTVVHVFTPSSLQYSLWVKDIFLPSLVKYKMLNSCFTSSQKGCLVPSLSCGWQDRGMLSTLGNFPVSFVERVLSW